MTDPQPSQVVETDVLSEAIRATEAQLGNATLAADSWAPVTGDVVGEPTTGPQYGEEWFGILAGRELDVTEEGVRNVKAHLQRLDDGLPPDPGNVAMISRLESALAEGRSIRGPDLSFYAHEVLENELMNRNAPYEFAHEASLARFGASRFSLYHPDVVNNPQIASWFSESYRRFWSTS